MKNSKIILISGLVVVFAFMLGLFLGRSNAGEIPSVFTEERSEDNGKINVNSATLDELCMLPGISEITAQNIIDYRDEYGPFTHIDELCQVSGISEQKLDALKDCVKLR